MPDESIESLHSAIHRSLREGDFDGAGRLSVELGQAIIKNAPAPASADGARFLEENLGRLQEHLSLARILRAHLASQLQTNTAVFLYQNEADSKHCWRYEA